MAAAVGTGSGAGPGPKRPRPEPPLRIGTHDGTFHCDEVLACYLLRLLPRYRDAEVLYENFVEEIDAIDNGIAQAEGEPRYALTTTLSARVGHLNPRWNDPDQDTEAGFKRAMELVGGEFMDRLDYYHRAWLPARALVEEAIQRRFEVEGSGVVLELPQGGCPWKEHLFHLEQELELPQPLQMVIFPDQGGQWRVQSVPMGPHTFQSRLPLPEPWRGLRDEALSELSGIPGCVFVHASGFIGGNRTREGALEMARRTLAQRQAGGAQSG